MTSDDAKKFESEFAALPDEAIGERLQTWLSECYPNGHMQWLVSRAQDATNEVPPKKEEDR
jgi:hypothetical protein